MTLDQALALVEQAAASMQERPARGADPEDLGRLEETLGFSLPNQLREWLLRCNGSAGGPGWIFGTRTRRPVKSIERSLKVHPEWKPRRWIPVADDECGDYYVLDASHSLIDTDAVLFVDTHVSFEEASYIVASEFLIFLTCLLEKELQVPGAERWPFDRDYTLTKDPGMQEIRDPALLPWEADDRRT